MLFFQWPMEVAVSQIYMCGNGGSESLDNLPSRYVKELRFKPDWIGPTRIKLHPPSLSLQLLEGKNSMKY